MGFENRDYVRGSGGGHSYVGALGGGFPPVVKWLIIANIAVFLLQSLWVVNGRHVFEQWLYLRPDPVAEDWQLWRLLTYAFCHDRDNLFHIVFNMLALWWFGPTLERMLGSREFAAFYLVSAVLSGAAYVAFGLFLDKPNPAVGASGAVVAVLMLYAVHFPRQVVMIWGVLPVQIRVLVGIYVIYDLYPVLRELGGGAPGGHVAHIAHLGGLAFGFAYGKLRFRLTRIFEGWRMPRLPKRRRHQPEVKLYEPPPTDNLAEQVDAILEKISQHGEASLTDRERELLKEASRRYKNR